MSETNLPAEQTEFLTRKELEAKIIAKAWTNEDFHRKFLEYPKGQFEEHLGVKLPETLTITAYQEDENHLYFVIPVKPPIDFDELSDEELEKVAGGIAPAVSMVITSVTSAATVVSLVTTVVSMTVVSATAIGSIATAASATASIAFGGWGRK